MTKSIGQALATPWGMADHIQDIGLGILLVETPSHGGYYVPATQIGRMSQEAKDYAAKWSGSEQWYEEDCAWAYVALAFPELFLPDALENATVTVAWNQWTYSTPFQVDELDAATKELRRLEKAILRVEKIRDNLPLHGELSRATRHTLARNQVTAGVLRRKIAATDCSRRG